MSSEIPPGTHISGMRRAVIIGVDEVGRGCIAGDLLVCAYALRSDLTPEDVTALRNVAMDSKAFSSRRRREDVVPMIERAGRFVIARRSPSEIDASNIRIATLDAMREAACAVREVIDGDFLRWTIVDGKDVPAGIPAPVEARIKGDTSVLEISCASVLAKVSRDREMERAAEIFPGYGFETHAGYATRQHREAIAALGLCDIHRSWARKFLA